MSVVCLKAGWFRICRECDHATEHEGKSTCMKWHKCKGKATEYAKCFTGHKTGRPGHRAKETVDGHNIAGQ